MGTSLIPIKGISQAQKRNLANNCKIMDIAGLLANGRTPEQRQTIASKLQVDKRHVSIWVKQADLWRVNGMTEDYAYLLVLAGVRCVQDLAKIDVETTRGVLKSISNIHPDFEYDSGALEDLKAEAAKLCPTALASHNLQLVIEALGKDSEELENFFGQFKDKYEQTALVFDANDPEPTHLFGMDYVLEVLDKKSESEIINEGLDALRGITVALPNPRYLTGKVTYRSIGEKKTRESINVANLRVDVDGVIKDPADSEAASEKNFAYTNAEGIFIITLPKDYTWGDFITFTISQGGCKQVFKFDVVDLIRNAVVKDSMIKKSTSELLEDLETIDEYNNIISVYTYDRKIVKVMADLHAEIESAKDDEETIEIRAKKELLNKLKNRVEILDLDDDLTKNLQLNYNKMLPQMIDKYLEGEINNYRKARDRIIDEDFGQKAPKKEKQRKVSYLIGLIELVWKYGLEDGEEGFVLIEEVFKGYKDDHPKALPSVKLMGEGEDAVMLPTDKAPSRTFSYSLLQRLVEPSIYPEMGDYDEEGKKRQRRKLDRPADVTEFQKSFGRNPDGYPIMSSLGMGYTLNLSQSWVPDGFALGELLYSLILAPGEEQRLIVRDSSSSYAIQDNIDAQDYKSTSQTQSQTDAILAMYDYAMGQSMYGYSEMDYSTKTTSGGGSAGGGIFGAISGIFGGLFGSGSGATSKSSGSASSSAGQTNRHNEASVAAQAFNQNFTVAASLYERANRVNIRAATSQERDSVATKIVANHNHSHTMTVQYWEVVRRYRLETAIQGIDLVLFVPLKPVRFLPETQALELNFGYGPECESGKLNSASEMTCSSFKSRYQNVIRHYSAIRSMIPYSYRNGLDLMQKFYAMPYFKIDKFDLNTTDERYYIEVTGNFLEFDNLSAKISFDNGTKPIYGRVINYTYSPLILRELGLGFAAKEFNISNANELAHEPHTRQEVKEAVIFSRNYNAEYVNSISFEFLLPYGTTKDNISELEIRNSITDGWDYALSQDEKDQTESENYAIKNYKLWMNKLYDNTKDRDRESEVVAQFKQGLPEWYFNPIATFSASELYSYGNLKITVYEGLTKGPALETQAVLSRSPVVHSYGRQTPKLTVAGFQEIERTFQHIVTNTLRYSRAVWQSMTTDDLAMLLEQYNVDMDFDNYYGDIGDDAKKDISDIPLLNCINVKKPLGFYGNCILFPFTYPEELAVKLGKTAAEVQDALYLYHASCFRSPSTVISIPTDGMIGEAVLGATNVSEKIDITRFWNWKDSPIDSMTLDSTYLNKTDYLSGKTTAELKPIGISSPALATPTSVNDVIKSLVEKLPPEFNDITGIERTAEILSKATESNATGRDTVLNKNAEMVNKVVAYATEVMKAQSAKSGNRNQGNPNNPDGGNKPNGDGNSGGGGAGGTGGAGGGGSHTAFEMLVEALYMLLCCGQGGSQGGKPGGDTNAAKPDDKKPDDKKPDDKKTDAPKTDAPKTDAKKS